MKKSRDELQKEYDEATVKMELVDSELFRDVLKNLLKLYNKQSVEESFSDVLP